MRKLRGELRYRVFFQDEEDGMISCIQSLKDLNLQLKGIPSRRVRSFL